MTLVGIIPAIVEEDASPLGYHGPMELIPIGVQMERGTKYFKPLVQVALEGMICGGVDHLVVVVTRHKESVQCYLNEGNKFGIPISYTFPRNPGLTWAVNSTYSLIQGCQVVMALPGITDSTVVTQTLSAHEGSGAELTVSVAQNTTVDSMAWVRKVTAKQMTGVFVWESRFTEWLRERVVESDCPHITFADVVRGAIAGEMSVRGVKLPYTPFVSDCASWARAVQLKPSAPKITEERLAE